MRLGFILGLYLLSAACGGAAGEASVEERCAAADAKAGIVRPEGWAPLSHCKLAPADVGKVFPIEVVGKMTISMTPAEYEAMKANLATLPGDGGGGGDGAAACVGQAERGACEIDVGTGPELGICVAEAGGALRCLANSERAPADRVEACTGHADGAACTTAEFAGHCGSDGADLACMPDDGGGGAPVAKNPCADKADGDACKQGARAGVCAKTKRWLVCQADGFDTADLSGEYDDAASEKPKYFHADVEYAGARWTSVGIRYKGNNGLETAAGEEKKPFRLKFDEWEDENKAVTDQRIFGFQALSFAPNQTDPTNLHQVLAAETFREAGVPAPYASFVEVYLDTGAGPRLLGLYAMTEFPDDQLPRRVFGEYDGNMYKPDGRGAHFVEFVAASMDKRNNKDADYKDVQDFIAALHGAQTDRAAWRARLGKTFDMVGFARMYALNQAMANFDTYGIYAHNSYLYNHGGVLTFLPWDFDYAFDGTPSNDLSLWSFGGEWPLLQALASDAELYTVYLDALATFAETQLASGKLAARAEALAALIRPALEREEAVRPGVLARFDAALPELKRHLEQQAAAIATLLNP